jgi:hypothetical protein
LACVNLPGALISRRAAFPEFRLEEILSYDVAFALGSA